MDVDINIFLLSGAIFLLSYLSKITRTDVKSGYSITEGAWERTKNLKQESTIFYSGLLC